MRHANDTEGNVPQRLFLPKAEEPSRRMVAWNRYLLLKL